MAGSLLNSLGFAMSMTAENRDDYVGLAVEWAVDENKRKSFRSTIAEHLVAAEALDPKARARDLETAYEEMWRASEGRNAVEAVPAA
jgi:predicted O-linked N-acetylglucosamine transferase (SPINDLY family)